MCSHGEASKKWGLAALQCLDVGCAKTSGLCANRRKEFSCSLPGKRNMIIFKNISSFVSSLFSYDPRRWKELMARQESGKVVKWKYFFCFNLLQHVKGGTLPCGRTFIVPTLAKSVPSSTNLGPWLKDSPLIRSNLLFRANLSFYFTLNYFLKVSIIISRRHPSNYRHLVMLMVMMWIA